MKLRDATVQDLVRACGLLPPGSLLEFRCEQGDFSVPYLYVYAGYQGARFLMDDDIDDLAAEVKRRDSARELAAATRTVEAAGGRVVMPGTADPEAADGRVTMLEVVK